MKLWLRRDSWDGVMADGTFWDLCGRGQPCALLMEGLSLPFLNQFWLLWTSAANHLGVSYIFHSAGVLARFPYGEWCCLASPARHGDGGWGKPLCACPALLWVKPCRQLAARGWCTEELRFPLGMVEFKGSCVKKHPYFLYNSSQTRAILVLSMI